MNIHPLAEAFPMMTDDELADLAADIKENGQIHPIIVDEDGTLVDGRNRLRACEIAGVEPTFAPLNGHDVAAFIVSTNIARRNLSKGQQAMALALLYPETSPGKRTAGSATALSVSNKVSTALISQARAIVRHSIELAHQVRDGHRHFDQAVAQVKDAEQISSSREAQLSELRAHASDVAALVSDGRLTLEAGMAELRERKQRVHQCLDAGRTSAARFANLAMHLTVIQTADLLTDADLAMVDVERVDADPLAALTDKDIDALVGAIHNLRVMKLARKDG
jgi:hypothetical protein